MTSNDLFHTFSATVHSFCHSCCTAWGFQPAQKELRTTAIFIARGPDRDLEGGASGLSAARVLSVQLPNALAVPLGSD